MPSPRKHKAIKPKTKIGSYVDNTNKVSDESSQISGTYRKSYNYGGSMKKRYMSGGIIQHD